MHKKIENKVYILLGTNEGDRLNYLNVAFRLISEQIGEIISQSAIYETAAWGIEDQASFLNQILLVHTELEPHQTLEMMLDVEKQMGRLRTVKWGSRIIDIDMLYYNDEIIDTKRLSIPHPYLHKRRFTLVPLCEIAPDFMHPVLKLTNSKLLEQCDDECEVSVI